MDGDEGEGQDDQDMNDGVDQEQVDFNSQMSLSACKCFNLLLMKALAEDSLIELMVNFYVI